MTNRPEYLESFFGALLLGAVPVNVNYRYVADEVRYVLDNSDARAVVHDPELARRGRRRRRRAPATSRPVVLETGGPYEAALAAAPTPIGPAPGRPTATT